MSNRNKSLTVILVIISAGVLLTSALIIYLFVTRQPGADNTASGEHGLPAAADSRIAYTTYGTDVGGPNALYISDLDGSNQHLLAESQDGRCIYPSWSPDGQKVAYLIHTPGENGELWDMNDVYEVWVATADDSEQIRISDVLPSIHQAHQVSWSPDGTRLAVLAEAEEDTTETIFIVRADGSGVEYSIPLDFWAIEMMLWSPAGSEMLFMPETDTPRMTAYVLSLDDHRVVPVYEVGMLDSWGVGVPLDWSPDGTEFALASPLAQELLIVSTGGAVRQASGISGGFPVEVAWSPNGRDIAVSVSTELLDAGDTSEMMLYILDIETGEFTLVFHEGGTMVTMPNWSSDGNRLLFNTVLVDLEGNWLSGNMWVYDVSTGSLEESVLGWGTIG